MTALAAAVTARLDGVLRDAVSTGLNAEDSAARLLSARGNAQGDSVLNIISNTVSAAVKAAMVLSGPTR